MSKVTFDYSKATSFIGAHEVDFMKKTVCDARDVLVSKTGAGNDFLGWIDLPVDYDKEEFARIKKAAAKIIPQKKRIRQSLIFISALGPQLGKPAGTGAAPQQDLVLCAMIGGQKSAPTAAAQDGKFHGAFSLLF